VFGKIFRRNFLKIIYKSNHTVHTIRSAHKIETLVSLKYTTEKSIIVDCRALDVLEMMDVISMCGCEGEARRESSINFWRIQDGVLSVVEDH